MQVLADALRRTRRRAGGALRWIRGGVATTVGDARSRVVDDLRTDPYLVYILALSFLLSVFWVWHRLPNFATRDERWRVVDPIEVLAAVLEDPSVEGFQEGITAWRAYGATMYLSALMLIPVAVVALATGQLDAFADMGRHRFSTGVDHWTHWQRVPAWMWTWSVLLVRLANVCFAVGSVYVTYRIGTVVRDRATGRLAALLCAVSWVLVILAHEAGEDVPSLFFFLLSVYFALRYLGSGARRSFYLACFAGGVAIAFKLSGGVSAVVLAAAYVLRARRTARERARTAVPDGDGAVGETDDLVGRVTERWRARVDALVRPRLLLGGLVVGLVTIAVAYPTILFGSPGEFFERLRRGTEAKSEIHGWRAQPSWWWILRGYLHGVGLPLFVGFLGAVAATLPRLRRRSRTTDALAAILVGVATFLAVYGTWSYVRTHHLLPTVPLLVVVLAVALHRLRDRSRTVGRVAIALLVVTTAVYAGVGTLGYASEPKDQATAWLERNAGNATLETYLADNQESAAPHGMNVDYVSDRMSALLYRCPEYVELNSHYALAYLAPAEWSVWAAGHSNPQKRRYVRRLFEKQVYSYEVAATFGPEPRYLHREERPPLWREMLRVGIHPRSIQYGDPQDLGVDQYTVIMRRIGSCTFGPDGSGGGGFPGG